jgi:tetratricopeptide (TPR) repeat protein
MKKKVNQSTRKEVTDLEAIKGKLSMLCRVLPEILDRLSDISAVNLLALLCTFAHLYEVSIPAWEESLRRDPNQGLDAYKFLASGYSRAGNYQKAIETLKKYLALSPCGEPELAQYELAKTLIEGKEYHEAIKYLKLSFATNSGDSLLHLRLGEAHLGLNDIESALKELGILTKICKTGLELSDLEILSKLIAKKRKKNVPLK